jgi:hydroxymethylpyrimidine pyrophosphatase-like HAD family hydrolase
MRYKSLACDFDGTLAEDGKISLATLAALDRLKSSGRSVLLVTGRLLEDLFQTFPEYAVCQRIVAENGALIYNPADCSTKRLADKPSPKFIEALQKLSVGPLEIGQSIVAAGRVHEDAILQAIAEMGDSLRPIYNKDAVMVLPAGVDKGTGLRAALADLGLSVDAVVGVGDAENDFALLNACGCGVAVANAVPGLKDCADITTKASAGKGVEELIEHVLRNDLGDVPVRRKPVNSW